MEKQKQTRILVIFSLVAGVILFVITYLAFLATGASNSDISVSEVEETLPATPLYQSYTIDLDPLAGIYVERLLTEGAILDISNRDEEPLMDAAEDDILLENMPWFYYSPNVAKVSPTSVVNRYPLVKTEPINAFTWHQSKNQLLLFQAKQPYTGWFDMNGAGWQFYLNGQLQEEYTLEPDHTEKWLEHANYAHFLLPLSHRRSFFLEHQYTYRQHFRTLDLGYSILYKNPETVILSSPPGTLGAVIRTTTENFVDMPLEVVGEVSMESGEWLHVYIGYEELGWIKKDSSYQDYVLTYYSERELLDAVEATLSEYMQYVSGTVGTSFVNNETMSQVSVNNQIFFPASTQKIYVMGELYHQYKTEELSPYQEVALTWDNIVPGAGIIQGSPVGTPYTLDYLVDLVAIYSDNTAANTLIETVGGGARITPHMHQLGLYDTYVNGKYYHSDTNGLFYTTPADSARFFALLYNDQVNGAPWDEMLIEKLLLNTHNFLRQGIPSSTRAWNKSGLGHTEQNDVATFVTPYGSYSLAAYTEWPWNYEAISDELAAMSSAVHEVFNRHRLLLWETVPDQEVYMQEIITRDEELQEGELFEQPEEAVEPNSEE